MDHHEKAPLKTLHKGALVRLKEGGPVWVKGDYCRTSKAYCLTRWDDISASITRKGTAQVFHSFTF